MDAFLSQRLRQLRNVDDVAVVGEQNTRAPGEKRLSVLGGALRARCGVADVGNAGISGELLDHVRGERVGDQPEVLDHAEASVVTCGNASSVLPPVLDGLQPKSQSRCGGLCADDRDESTHGDLQG